MSLQKQIEFIRWSAAQVLKRCPDVPVIKVPAPRSKRAS